MLSARNRAWKVVQLSALLAAGGFAIFGEVVAGLAALLTVVEAVFHEAHLVLAHAEATVFGAGAILLHKVADGA
jgi:hypothetical protein